MTDFTPTQNPLPSLIRMIVSGTARHILTSAATLLAGYGAISTDQETQFVSIGGGIIVWLAGVAWSAANKTAVADAVNPT